MVLGPSVIGAVFTGMMLLSPWFAILAVSFLAIAGYFAYARYMFAVDGGDVQGRIWSALVEAVDWDGNGMVLDIGCGSGALSIRLARRFQSATVVGVDYWGKGWGYSKAICEYNANCEGVQNRTSFRQASASALPFPDESFDLVVSNLTFHEVKDIQDKRQLLREALRVLKKGGRFAFQDLFLMKRIYGNTDDLVQSLKVYGATEAALTETCEASFIPRTLKLSFMVGTMGLISGRK